MARIIYPINGKTYTAEDVEIFNAPRTSGIYSVLDFDCSLSGNVLTIGKGLAWIKNGDFTGKSIAFTEPETLTLDSADSTKNRFDVVAIRYDASKTEPELVIIKGKTGDIPMLPERKKETYLYELFLYAILRKAGEGSASFENLSDLRDDETFCGIMRDSVTSSVAPLYETLYDDETGMSLVDGHPIPVETDKYVSYVATVKNSDMIVEIPLYAFDDTSFAKKINGKRVISTSGGSETTFLITFECFPENISISDIFWSSDTGNGQAILTKLVGVTKQPEGYVKVDDIYNPESHNAQSGEAVKQAIDEALAGFEMPQNVENTDNKISNIDENSTDEQYPSAKAVKISLDKQASETNVKLEKLNEDLTILSTKTEINISDVSAEVTNNKTQIENTEEKVDLLKTNVDLLNEGGLLLKEDFIGNQVNSWLDEHPEATTTVQDKSRTSNKMNSEMKEWIRSNTINVKDFGAVGDGVTDDTQAIKSAFDTLGDYGLIIFPKGHYIVKPTADKQSLIDLTGLKDITIDLNGSTLEVATNGYPYYNLFELIDCENFVITNGTLKGDRLTHDYTTISGTHGFGYGVFLRSSLTSEEEPSDTLKCGGEISNCEIYNFTGDAIVTKNGLSPATIIIRGCKLHHCRRQGISVLDSDTVIIDNCHIHHIGEFDGISGVTGTSPMCGIDIEAISGTKTVNFVNVKNTVIENVSQYAIVAVTKKTYETIDGVSTLTSIEGNVIKKILIENCRTDVLVIECNKTDEVGEAEEFTDVLVNNCILNHTIAVVKYKPFNLTGAIVKDSIINTENKFDYTNKELFSSGSTHTTKARCYITGCTLNLSEQAIVRWVELINTTVNGGVLKINEGKDIAKAVSTIMDCTNVNFNGCSFNIMNLYGWYKFFGCSFKDCVPFGTSKPLKFYNCYLDSEYVPGASYVNCTIEDEIQG